MTRVEYLETRLAELRAEADTVESALHVARKKQAHKDHSPIVSPSGVVVGVYYDEWGTFVP